MRIYTKVAPIHCRQHPSRGTGTTIATTSADVAITVLDHLAASPVRFAILHGEDALAAGHCESDVDIVTNQDARAVVSVLGAGLRAVGLHPIVVWPYDVGSASVFVVDTTGRDGAQFDILHDPDGAGHYGIRAKAVLERARPGARWPVASREHELLYLVRKRHRKGQWQRLAALRAQARTLVDPHLDRLVDETFSAPSAAVVRAVFAEEDAPRDRLRFARGAHVNLARLVRRIARPVGFWVSMDGPAAQPAAQELAGRLGRILPIVGSAAIGPGIAGVAALRDVARVRWRAGIYCSWGGPPAIARPDLHLHATNGAFDEVARRTVAAMENRFRP